MKSFKAFHVLGCCLPLAAASGFGVAQTSKSTERKVCLDVSKTTAEVELSGRLDTESFPGPPNYESIASGDTEERAYILTLASPICLTDGGQFADPEVQFDRVHVGSSKPELLRALKTHNGDVVTVTGHGFAAHNGHHHAPLVVSVEKITPKR